jgi:DNA-directed RNA polymerase subunit RPC12/RpoP
MSQPEDYFNCPYCGAEVKKNALACPECGSDDSTGWSDGPDDMSILPPDDFDYEESLKREFGDDKKAPLIPGWVAITGFVLLMLLVLVFLL